MELETLKNMSRSELEELCLLALNKEHNQTYKIKKTIEYIEYNLKSFLYSEEYKTLLEILKGDK